MPGLTAKGALATTAITLLADSNALRDPGLRHFLERSRDHFIALSDMTLVEMRKRNALSTCRESLRIIGQFPGRVFVLRRTDLMLNERIANRADADRLFDFEASLELEGLCRDLTAIPVPLGLEARMQNEEAEAQLIMTRLTDEVSGMEPALIEATKSFNAAELSQIRTGRDVSDKTRMKILNLLKETTGNFILNNQEPGRRVPMRLTEAMQLFAFRYSLCTLLYYMLWVKNGRSTKKLSRRVNDVVDMQVAAMATFFNGVLSGDDGLQQISHGSRAVLRGFGAYVGDDWVPEF
jgi:hypothetical protein